MITYKCKNCCGEMSISPGGDLYCTYCGSKGNFSDGELRGYREFRKQLLSYLESVAGSNAEGNMEERLWEYAEQVAYKTREGQQVTIRYLFQAEDDGIKIYMARESVLFLFDRGRYPDADRMLEGIAKVKIPQADMKGLTRYIPHLKTRLELDGGGVLLAFTKEKGMYPLGAFGSLDYRNAAWLMSRLENLCCMLEYSDLLQGGITLEGIFINPYTHEAALYGGWWKTLAYGGGSPKDLTAIRQVCLKVLGADKRGVPEAFLHFLNEKPVGDAYMDFAAWDQVIEKKLGGRHFHEMTLEQITKEVQ